MKVIAPNASEITWAGAVSVEPGDGWWRPWRIPYDRFDLFPPDGIGTRAGNATGVRLAFMSDTRSVEIVLGESTEPDCIDLVRDNELIDTKPVPTEGGTVLLEGAPAGMKRVEVWLPRKPTRVKRLAIDEDAVARPFNDRRPRWTTYGSSITECKAAYSPSRTWPGIVARERDLNLTCFGFGGNCHAEPMVAMTIRDIPADLITLSMGINIQGGASLSPRTFMAALIGVVEIIREKQPDVPIIMVSPILSPPRETEKNIVGLSLTDMREAHLAVVDALKKHGADPIHYVDGLKVFGQAELEAGFLPDNLHPNADGYCKYAENYLREVMTLVDLPEETQTP